MSLFSFSPFSLLFSSSPFYFLFHILGRVVTSLRSTPHLHLKLFPAANFPPLVRPLRELLQLLLLHLFFFISISFLFFLLHPYIFSRRLCLHLWRTSGVYLHNMDTPFFFFFIFHYFSFAIRQLLFSYFHFSCSLHFC